MTLTDSVIIEHSTMLDSLYAKVVFDLKMTGHSKIRLVDNWNDFKENVELAITNIDVIKPINN